jgi:hypothetical protein
MNATRALYLDLIERCLLNTIYEDPPADKWSKKIFDAAKRENGRDWPSQAHTMIGRKRMANLRTVVETALSEGIPGDLIETGVWRGGACIYMRAILAAYGDTKRKVFVADSFEGLPRPNASKYPADAGDPFHKYKQLAVSIEQVRDNFSKYGLLDDQVVFLRGWFKDTLPTLEADRFAVIRLDGDMYESTTDALTNLYDRLSPGGFVIIDDFFLEGCRRAVEDFRSARAIDDAIHDIDGMGSYWRRAA